MHYFLALSGVSFYLLSTKSQSGLFEKLLRLPTVQPTIIGSTLPTDNVRLMSIASGSAPHSSHRQSRQNHTSFYPALHRCCQIQCVKHTLIFFQIKHFRLIYLPFPLPFPTLD